MEARHLQAVPVSGFDGDVTPDNFRLLLARVRELEVHEERLENELKGKRLQIAKLEADREQDALDSPERPQVEALHACHKAATKANKKTPSRKKRLDAAERENTTVCARKLGFRECLKAVVGLTWDPSFSPPRRNGTRECFNSFELCFRTTSHAQRFAERAPIGWKPDAKRVAEIANVPLERVREWLGETE